ncbi:MAG: hydrogenase nickel incorporation protein HypB [Oleiphilaceae bacterium]
MKSVVLSVTEGENKPLKYPDMFHASSLMLINKMELLPCVDFNLDQCIKYARRINPSIEVIYLSAKTSEGMDAWLNWLRNQLSGKVQGVGFRPFVAILANQLHLLGYAIN